MMILHFMHDYVELSLVALEMCKYFKLECIQVSNQFSRVLKVKLWLYKEKD